jgi:anaerobic selenocysteine-containing dehydrogenase
VDCRDDYEILRDFAGKLGLDHNFWGTKEKCLDHILEPVGVTFDEFRRIGVLMGSKQYRSYQSQGFPTPSGEVELYSSQLEGWRFDPLPTYHEPPKTAHSNPELAKDYPLGFHQLQTRALSSFEREANHQAPGQLSEANYAPSS